MDLTTKSKTTSKVTQNESSDSLKEFQEKIEELYDMYWSDDYVNSLTIVDGCRRLIDAWDKYGNYEIHDWDSQIADLFIQLLFQLHTRKSKVDFSILLERVKTLEQMTKRNLQIREVLKGETK